MNKHLESGLPLVVSRLAVVNLIYGDYYESSSDDYFKAKSICPLCGKEKSWRSDVCGECHIRYGEEGMWVICCALSKLRPSIWKEMSIKPTDRFLDYTYRVAKDACNGSSSVEELFRKVRSMDDFKTIPRRFIDEAVKKAYANSQQDFPTITEPQKSTSLEQPQERPPDPPPEVKTKPEPARIIRLPEESETSISSQPGQYIPKKMTPDEFLFSDEEIHIPSIFHFVEEKEIRKLVSFSQQEFKVTFPKARLFSVRYKAPISGCQSAILALETPDQRVKFVLCYVYEKARKGRRGKDSTPHLEWVHILRKGHRDILSQLPLNFRKAMK